MYLKASLPLNLFPVFPRLISYSLGNTISKQIATHPYHSSLNAFWLSTTARWTQFSKCGVTLIFQSLSYLSGFTKFTLNLSSKSVFLFLAVFILFLSVSSSVLVLFGTLFFLKFAVSFCCFSVQLFNSFLEL